jgi:Tubulin-tyrosine ligase family
MMNLVPGFNYVTGKKKLVDTLTDAYGEAAFQLTPHSFTLPEELESWKLWTAQQRCPPDELWMLKSGANRGHGLRLAPLAVAQESALDPLGHTQFKRFCVAQQYIADPLLVDGRKFHIRLWVVVSRVHVTGTHSAHEHCTDATDATVTCNGHI